MCWGRGGGGECGGAVSADSVAPCRASAAAVQVRGGGGGGAGREERVRTRAESEPRAGGVINPGLAT